LIVMATPRRRRIATNLVPLALSCDVCGDESAVSSRQEFSHFEEAHSRGCGLQWIAIGAPLDAVLDLPPR
jgi:hypothetical protein